LPAFTDSDILSSVDKARKKRCGSNSVKAQQRNTRKTAWQVTLRREFVIYWHNHLTQSWTR